MIIWNNSPTLAKQHEIVRRVRVLFERADQIEREIEALVSAVPGKAFGEVR